MIRYVAYILVTLIAVALAGSVAAVLGGGLAECLAGRPAVSLSVFDAVGPAGGHWPWLRAVMEGPGGPKPLGPCRLLARFPDGWSRWAWVSRNGLARWKGPADLPPGPHRFRVGMPEVHPRLDVAASATAWIWPRGTPVFWVDASALVPPARGPASVGDVTMPPPAARAGFETLKTLAPRCRCVYLVAEEARGYAAARHWLKWRVAPAGPAFWVIPGRAAGRLKGLKGVWPTVRGAVVASDDLADAARRLEVPLVRVPAAGAEADPPAVRAAWRRVRERFTAPVQTDSSNGR